MMLTPDNADVSPLPHVHHACEKCGAPLDADDKFCPACGAIHSANTAPTEIVEQQHFRCKSCGAEVAVAKSSRSFTCPFCESNYVIEFSPTESGRQPPEFVVGFHVTKEQAQQRFQEWISAGGLFRPSDLPLAQVVEKLRGVYLPFWSFSMLAESAWSVNIGEHWYRTETYTTTEDGKTVTRTRQVQETEWYPLGGRHQNYHNGYLIAAGKGLSQQDTDKLGPFRLESLKRYDPAYLAGWLSEEYVVERDAALQLCQTEFRRREEQQVQRFMPGDTYSGLSVATEFSDENSDLILLPVYLLRYHYGAKDYQFLLNGQTGKIVGKKPVSMRRVLVAVALGVAAIVALWWSLR